MKTMNKSPIQGIHPNLLKTIQESDNFTFENTATTTNVYRKTLAPLRTPSPRIDVSNCKRIMFFDVETTGLPPFKMNPDNPESVDLTLVPYITQLSFVIYDTDEQNITNIFNEYIYIPEDVVIHTHITDITGIDRNTLDTKGYSMFYALSIFLQNLKECDCLVAHNISFDMNMIQFEMLRYGICQTGVFNNVMQYCTMKYGKPICQLRSQKTGWIKPPKLSELYFHLFQETAENLHNSIVDVLVCFRCFLKMEFDSHIPSDVFSKMIKFNL